MKTWVDIRTGLEWAIETVSGLNWGLNWYEARDYAKALGDFRLPTRAELSTLIDDKRYNPAHWSPIDIHSRNFWTSSQFVGGAWGLERGPDFPGEPVYNEYWFVSFKTGYTGHKRVDNRMSACFLKER